jgi:hypothetical protein
MGLLPHPQKTTPTRSKAAAYLHEQLFGDLRCGERIETPPRTRKQERHRRDEKARS